MASLALANVATADLALTTLASTMFVLGHLCHRMLGLVNVQWEAGEPGKKVAGGTSGGHLLDLALKEEQ